MIYDGTASNEGVKTWSGLAAQQKPCPLGNPSASSATSTWHRDIGNGMHDFIVIDEDEDADAEYNESGNNKRRRLAVSDKYEVYKDDEKDVTRELGDLQLSNFFWQDVESRRESLTSGIKVNHFGLLGEEVEVSQE